MEFPVKFPPSAGVNSLAHGRYARNLKGVISQHVLILVEWLPVECQRTSIFDDNLTLVLHQAVTWMTQAYLHRHLASLGEN